jgi:hypothetical protein
MLGGYDLQDEVVLATCIDLVKAVVFNGDAWVIRVRLHKIYPINARKIAMCQLEEKIQD